MGSHLGLSDAEYLLMEMFWSCGRPLSFTEIVDYCNGTLGQSWAKTTIHTFLTRLVQKGVLQVENGRKKHIYYARMSHEDLTRAYAGKFVEETFHGSMKGLIRALTGGITLSQKDAEELKQLLDICVAKSAESSDSSPDQDGSTARPAEEEDIAENGRIHQSNADGIQKRPEGSGKESSGNAGEEAFP